MKVLNNGSQVISLEALTLDVKSNTIYSKWSSILEMILFFVLKTQLKS